MRSLRHLLRLLPLFAAALASVATSSMTTFLEIDAASPGPDESAVAADAVLTVRARVTSGPAPAGLRLRTRTHFDIAGRSERHQDADGELVYTFTPDAPLGPDDFVLVFDGDDVECGFPDPDLGPLHAAYDADGDRDAIVRFTTVSRPAVRYIAHPDPGTFIVSFSEPMDEDTLAAVHVVDPDDVIVPAATIWHGAALSYELQATPGLGAYKIRFDEGVVAASGVPLPGLPFTLAPTRP